VFTILSPFPGTNLYDEVRDSLTTTRTDLIDFFHTVMPTRLPLEQFYGEYAKLWSRAYLSAGSGVVGTTDNALKNPRMSATLQTMTARLTGLHCASRDPGAGVCRSGPPQHAAEWADGVHESESRCRGSTGKPQALPPSREKTAQADP